MALIGRSALVTGGSRGIGRAIVLELARQGADVAFLYRSNEAAAAETVERAQTTGRTVIALRCNIVDHKAVAHATQEAAERIGPLAMVVSSAGAAAPVKPLHDLTFTEWQDFLDVDLTGTFNVAHHAIRHFRQHDRGVFIAISSIAVRMAPAKNACGAAAKAGVEALVRSIAREEARNGIRANAVAVGITDTDMLAPLFKEWGEKATERVLASIPLRRTGKPEDVAKAVAFLVSEDASYVTGKILEIDGGQHIGG